MLISIGVDDPHDNYPIVSTQHLFDKNSYETWRLISSIIHTRSSEAEVRLKIYVLEVKKNP